MDADVVVVGGGPCGHLTALLLGRLGLKTVLLEKHPHVLDHPKAMGITARTAEILRQLGLLEAALSGRMPRHPDAVSQWIKDGLTGELLGQAAVVSDTNPYSPCTAFHCPQPHIEKVLRSAVSRVTTIQCIYGARVTEVGQDPDSVFVRYEMNNEEHHLSAAFMVAADGDQSFVRQQLGIERHGPGELGRFLSVYFKADLEAHIKGRLAYLSNVLGNDWFEVFVAVNGSDLWLMQHYLDEGETAEQHDAHTMQALIRRACGLPDLDIDVISISPWVMSPAIASQWRSGRIFLVGDAAARVSPAGGLGMNNGLQSAHNLAWKLARVIHEEVGPDLLDSYQAERLAAARFTFDNSSGNTNEIFEIVTAAMYGKWEEARALIARSRRAGAGYGQDFGITYQSAALIPDGSAAKVPEDMINDYIEQARPGHRAPVFSLIIDGKPLKSLDLSSYRFVAWLGPHASRELFKAVCPEATVYIEGEDFESVSKDWKETYGISDQGGVLVRPDGYVYSRIH